MSAAAPVARGVVSPALRSLERQYQCRIGDTLSKVREEAMNLLLSLGLPSNQDESWRYTNLRALNGIDFNAAGDRQRNEREPFASASLLGEDQRALTILMVNGHPWLDSSHSCVDGIEVHALKDLMRVEPASVARFFETPSSADNRRWALLNTALFDNGLYIKIKTKVETPLVILHVGIGGDTDIAHPRVIIEFEAGGGATIIEHHVASGEHAVTENSHALIALGREAQLEHYRVFSSGSQATHFDFLDLRQERNSRCRQFTIALGGGLVRTDMDARLSEPGATIESQALLVGHDGRHVDCVNVVTHAARDTVSRQTARAIASDTSRVVFNSKVIVEAAAVQSESQQSCRGLLLSQTAEIDTRPQLEIHTDEVKCAHGATTGRLDPEMLFYLLSRGLDRNSAQSLLVFAFLADVLTGMSLPSARASIENSLIGQMPDSELLRNFR